MQSTLRSPLRSPLRTGLLLALALCCTQELTGQFLELERAHVPASARGIPHAIDVDGDGDHDLLLLDRDRPALLLQTSPLVFSEAPRTWAPEARAWADGLWHGDFDGDGDLDLVDRAPRLWINRGRGDFVLAAAGRLPAPPTAIADVGVADIDGDGDLDLLLASNSTAPGTSCYVYVNQGQGQFVDRTATQAAGPLVADALHVDDVDADGDPDVLFRGSGRTHLWMNAGRGTFRNGTGTLPARSSTSPVEQLLLSDLDQDRDRDLLALLGNGEIEIWWSDGTGNYRYGGTDLVALGRRFGASAALADLHADGERYLIVSSMGADRGMHAVWRRGQFVAVEPALPPGTFVRQIVDLDGDGDGDLLGAQIRYVNLTTSYASAVIVANLGATAGKRSGSRAWLAAAGGAGMPPLFDANDDGHLDMLVHRDSWPPYPLAVGLGEGHGYFEASSQLSLPASFEGYVRTAVAGDLDGDSDVDLLIPSGPASAQELQYYERGVSGSWTLRTNRLPAGTPGDGRVQLLDLDQDGDLDVVVESATYQGTLLNDGAGRFAQHASGISWAKPWSFSVFADLDGDRDVDVLQVANGSLAAFANDGKANFADVSNTWLTAAPGPATPLLALDIDGDGDRDVLVRVSATAPALAVLVNDGTGRLTLGAGLLPSLLGADVADAADIDLDGDQDLAVLEYLRTLPNGARVQRPRLLRNDGTGRFTDATTTWLGSQNLESHVIAGLWLRDMDGDGDADLVTDRVYYNLDRQLHTPHVARVGAAWTHVYSLQPGRLQGAALVLPLLGLARQRIHVPGIGTLGVDPTRMIVQMPLLLPAGTGVVSSDVRIPAQPALAGLEIHLQGLFLHAPPAAPLRMMLSSTLSERIGG